MALRVAAGRVVRRVGARAGRAPGARRRAAGLPPGGCSATDGWFEARYDIATRRAPDDRVAQLDGSGWALWGGSPGRGGGPRPRRRAARAAAAPARALLAAPARLARRPNRAAPGVVRLLGARRAHPDPRHRGGGAGRPPQRERGAAARGRDGARRPHARGIRPAGAQVRARFGPDGYPRLLGGSSADAAVTFLVAPIGPSGGRPTRSSVALERAQASMGRPAGGLAPGESWKNDGVSWTPETALFAAAWAATGHRSRAESLLGWLGDHRTDAGSFPEKVLHDGRPAAVAPVVVDGRPRRHRPARAGARREAGPRAGRRVLGRSGGVLGVAGCRGGAPRGPSAVGVGPGCGGRRVRRP